MAISVPVNYRPQTIRGICIALENDLKKLYVDRYRKDGTKEKTIEVGFHWGHGDPLQVLMNRTDWNRYYQKLPEVSIVWTGVQFDGERAASLNVQRFFTDADGHSVLKSGNVPDDVLQNLSPIPYNFTFDIQIRTALMSDFTQLMEQMLPFYEPERFLRVKEFSFLNMERNLKVVLQSVSQDFMVDIAEDDKRALNGVLQIEVQAFLYKPLAKESLIKIIDTKYIASEKDMLEQNTYLGYDPTDLTTPIPTSGFNTSALVTNESGQDIVIHKVYTP